LRTSIFNQLEYSFFHHPDIKSQLPDLEQKVADLSISPFEAAKKLLEIYRQSPK